MSGGSFNYAFGKFENFTEELRDRLAEDDRGFEPQTIAVLMQIADLTQRAAIVAKEVEWLYSFDIGEDTFMERVQKIIGEQP